MQVSEFLEHVNYALRGIDDETPLFGSDEANQWLATLNRKKNELYEDVKQRWSNTYAVLSVGTVTVSATPEFSLSQTFLAPSGDNSVYGEHRTGAYIVKTDGSRVNLTLVKPEERSGRRAVFIAGQNPQKLYFTNAVTADEDIIGGALYLPGYFMPADLEGEDDELPFLDPYWGVMAVAAEIAFNDIVYENKAPDINEKANNLWRQMVAKNRRGTYGSPRITPTSVYRIASPRRR